MNCETNDCRKEKRGCKGCYYNKSADEMFEELGYKKNEGLRSIDFCNKYGLLQFDKNSNVIHIDKCEYTDFITMKELQAINKKVEELGWKI